MVQKGNDNEPYRNPAMKSFSLPSPNPASELIEFHFVNFLRDLDSWNRRNATTELNRRIVRNFTRDQLARAH